MVNGDTLYKTPQATESFFLEEAYYHREILNHLDSIFTLWGYLPTQTPVFDFFDSYSSLLRKEDISRIYRLIDRDGELLMLRSDATLFLARQAATGLTSENLPARLWYADSILRHQEIEEISHNEFFQVGAELIGSSGIFGDLEVLSLLSTVLDRLDLKQARIHLGSRALFDTCFWEKGSIRSKSDTANIRVQARTAVRDRDWGLLSESLRNWGYTEDETAPLCELFSFIGNRRELEAFNKQTAGTKMKELPIAGAIGELIGSIETDLSTMEELGFGDYFRADLSEIGSQPYHTGIAFQAYVPGVDSAVVSGGRYDRLLSHFGFNAPSVGFSMLLRKIETQSGGPAAEIPDMTTVEQQESFIKTFRTAEKRRENSIICKLS
ncbi:MAG: ATP phosphoribosyltransferase regulatory subunit [Spirochaetales bacterium]|nr:ATP phosphoribosyltransferase regulatory subunit [Spirochaetales bacterium]MCF7937073.1 ATP phosphoribosyltransferase regulatory subunit [Spirochaetales bacterium]